jgi:hypothetical protein
LIVTLTLGETLVSAVQARSGSPRAPMTLGRFVLDPQLSAALLRRRPQLIPELIEKGVPDPLLVIYALPGSPPTGPEETFLLEAGETTVAAGDFRAGLGNEAEAFRTLKRPVRLFTRALSGAAFTCMTVSGSRGHETTCVWQDHGAVVMGLGLNLSPTETLSLTSIARQALRLS